MNRVAVHNVVALAVLVLVLLVVLARMLAAGDTCERDATLYELMMADSAQ